MGIFIIGTVICAFLFYGALMARFKSWLKGVLALLGFISLGGLLCFGLADPFSVVEAPELIDTYELVSLKEGDEVYAKETSVNIRGKLIKLDVKYNLPSELDESIDLFFLDSKNDNVYFLTSDKVFVTKTNNIDTTNYNEIYSHEFEIVKGDYEKPYVEKYEEKTKMTFLSMGITTKIHYKFYIIGN